MRKTLQVLVTIGLGLILTRCAAAQDGGSGPRDAKPAPASGWKVLADIPQYQLGCAGAVLGGHLHIIGGCTWEGGTSTLHQVFDSKKNAWVQKAPLPQKSGWPAVAVFGGKIYVFGGDCKGIDAKPTARSFVYDPAKNAWKDIAPLPAPRCYAAATTVGDFIYIYGARTLKRDQDDLSTYRYDPEENTYTRMADLPEGARFLTQGHYEGNIYVIHGETSKETYAKGVLQYDIVHNEWKKLDIPRIVQTKWTLTQHSSSVVLGSRLYVAGGKPPTAKRTPLVTYFDMKTRTFGQVEQLPEGRCCGAGGIIDGTLYVAGGFWELGALTTCKVTWGLPLPKP